MPLTGSVQLIPGSVIFAGIHLPRPTLDELGLRPCCLLPRCTLKPGSTQCGAGTAFIRTARSALRGAATSAAIAQKRERDDAEAEEGNKRLQVAIGRKAAMQKCRKWSLGRCCENPDHPDHSPHGTAEEAAQIKCCSARQEGEHGYHEKHRLCYYDAANCPFKDHDPTRQKHAAPPAADATTDQELLEGVEGLEAGDIR